MELNFSKNFYLEKINLLSFVFSLTIFLKQVFNIF